MTPRHAATLVMLHREHAVRAFNSGWPLLLRVAVYDWHMRGAVKLRESPQGTRWVTRAGMTYLEADGS